MHGAKNGLTAERVLSVLRSCCLPDSRRPNQLEVEGLKSERQHGQRQLGGESDVATANTPSGSMHQYWQSRMDRDGERAVGAASAASERGGAIFEGEGDVIRLVLHYLLTGNLS